MTKSVIISSTKGGTGKTTIAINLAMELDERGVDVGFIDADIESSNFADFLNINDGQIKISETKKFIPYEWDGIEVFSMSLLSGDKTKPISMTGNVHRRLLNDIVDSTRWGNIDTFVVDLPSGASDIFKESLYVFGDDLAGGIIVMQPMNITDARRILGLHQSNEVPILGLLENMAYFDVPYGKGSKTYHIFGEPIGADLADEFDVPFLGELPLSIDITKGIEKGEPKIPNDIRDPITKAADNVQEAETISILGKLKKKVKEGIKSKAEEVLASFILSANKRMDISRLQDRHNFHERRPFDFVILSNNRQKVLSRTHCKVVNGKLKVLKNANPDFEIEMPFETLCRILLGKRKRNGKFYEYDAEDAWLEGEVRVYGRGSSPRLVKVARGLFNERTLRPIRKKYTDILKKFV